MNQAASYLAGRKELHGALQNERLMAEGKENEKVIPATSGLVMARSLVFKKWQGSITPMISLV